MECSASKSEILCASSTQISPPLMNWLSLILNAVSTIHGKRQSQFFRKQPDVLPVANDASVVAVVFDFVDPVGAGGDRLGVDRLAILKFHL